MRKMKKIAIYLGLLIFIVLLVVFLINLRVKVYANDFHYNLEDEMPKNKVGLLLGTSQYRRGGGENLYFKYRVEAAAQLFLTGKIDYILVSGDNAEISY